MHVIRTGRNTLDLRHWPLPGIGPLAYVSPILSALPAAARAAPIRHAAHDRPNRDPRRAARKSKSREMSTRGATSARNCLNVQFDEAVGYIARPQGFSN